MFTKRKIKKEIEANLEKQTPHLEAFEMRTVNPASKKKTVILSLVGAFGSAVVVALVLVLSLPVFRSSNNQTGGTAAQSEAMVTSSDKGGTGITSEAPMKSSESGSSSPMNSLGLIYVDGRLVEQDSIRYFSVDESAISSGMVGYHSLAFALSSSSAESLPLNSSCGAYLVTSVGNEDHPFSSVYCLLV
jgi:hypothetical protein